MKPRKVAKRLRDLERAVGAHIDAEYSNGGHLKLTVNGNIKISVSATPSDWRSDKNAIRDIRRALGQI